MAIYVCGQNPRNTSVKKFIFGNISGSSYPELYYKPNIFAVIFIRISKAKFWKKCLVRTFTESKVAGLQPITLLKNELFPRYFSLRYILVYVHNFRDILHVIIIVVSVENQLFILISAERVNLLNTRSAVDIHFSHTTSRHKQAQVFLFVRSSFDVTMQDVVIQELFNV